jgi:hypothetical protein
MKRWCASGLLCWLALAGGVRAEEVFSQREDHPAGVLGSFFLEVEGVRQRPKVKFVGTEK